MVEFEYDESVVYCSVEDVAKLFRKEAAFAQNSNPSDAQVLDFIHEASSSIDDYTRYAWRANKVIEETKTFDGNYKWATGRPAVLSRHPVRTPLDSAEGDKIEVWEGNDWNEWVADNSKSEGRREDYWVEDKKILWVYRRFIWHSGPQLRLSYRYGKDSPTSTKTLDDGTTYEVIDKPRSIRRACSRLAAIDLVVSDQYTNLIPGGDGAPSPDSAIQQWENQVYGTSERKGILERHKVDPAWVEPL